MADQSRVGIFLLDFLAPEGAECLLHYQGPRDLTLLKGSLTAAYRVSRCETLDFAGDYLAAFSLWTGADPPGAHLLQNSSDNAKEKSRRVGLGNDHGAVLLDDDVWEDVIPRVQNDVSQIRLVLCVLFPRSYCWNDKRIAVGWTRTICRICHIRHSDVPFLIPFRFQYVLPLPASSLADALDDVCTGVFPCVAPRATREMIPPLIVPNKSSQFSLVGHCLMASNVVYNSTLPKRLLSDCVLLSHALQYDVRTDESPDVYGRVEDIVHDGRIMSVSVVAFEAWVHFAVFEHMNPLTAENVVQRPFGVTEEPTLGVVVVDPLSTDLRIEYLTRVVQMRPELRFGNGIPRHSMQVSYLQQRCVCDPSLLNSETFMLDVIRSLASLVRNKNVSEIAACQDGEQALCVRGHNSRFALFSVALGMDVDLDETAFRICSL
eukprot:ANDGO_06556.mRNA.1 hypothetical protein